MLERKMRLQDILSYFLITAKCNERLMLIRVRFFKRPLMKNNEATWLFETLILLQYKYSSSNSNVQNRCTTSMCACVYDNETKKEMHL